MGKPFTLALLALLLLPVAGAAVGWEIACGDECCPCSGLAPRACAGCACCPGPVSLPPPPCPGLSLAVTAASFAPAALCPASAPPRGVFHVPRPA